MLRSGWWLAFAAIGVVAACDLNPQPEVPAEQVGDAGQNGGLGGTGGVLNSGGTAGAITGAGGGLDFDAMADDAMMPGANEAGDGDAADADADADLDASDADASD